MNGVTFIGGERERGSIKMYRGLMEQKGLSLSVDVRAG